MQMVRAERRRRGGSPVIDYPLVQNGVQDWAAEAVRERPDLESLVNGEAHYDRIV